MNYRIAQRMKELVDRKAFYTYFGCSLFMDVAGKAHERNNTTLK